MSSGEDLREAAAIGQLNEELGPALAGQFLALADAINNDRPIDERAFRAATFDYFDAHLAAGTNPDTYFNWIGQVALPRPGTPLAHTGLWEWAMRIAHEWEASRGKHVHKGSGYYFAGIRDIALGDLDRGFLYMHQAAIEDIYPDRDRLPDSPAGWFISLDARRSDQTYHDKVLEYEAYLERQLAAYRAAARGTLTLDDLRARYQAYGDLLDAVTTVAHIVARLTRLDSSRTREILDNRFAAVLLTQISLELCLVLEDVLHRVIGTDYTLGGLAIRYPTGIGIAFKRSEVNELKTLGWTVAGFDSVVAELLAGTSVSGLSRPLSQRETDLAIALLLRDKSAHGLERPGAAARQFDQIVPRLFFALFAALEDLYR
jgi:hypothetical protein